MNEDTDAYCYRMVKKIQADLSIPELGAGSVDLGVEASGAPTCVQIGVAVLRPA